MNTYNDELILTLGETIDKLVSEAVQQEERSSKAGTPKDKNRHRQLSGDIYERVEDLGLAISALSASSLEAAAVQLRILNGLGDEDGRTAVKRRVRIHHSVLGVIEQHGGGSREKWAGDYYINQWTNPFKLEEATPSS